ncbi:MAG: S8 family serine peptidase, partial [Bacteroidetes bacterium]|nr:S8 family serine peptidase [Bacteroidota bacterium]
ISILPNDLPLTTAYVDSLQNLGLQIRNLSKWFNAVTVESYDTALLDTITQLSFVAGKEKVMKFRHSSIGVLSPLNSEKRSEGFSGVKSYYNYGPAAHQVEMLNGHQLHDLGYRGEGMQIAVIDAGFSNADVHPVFDSIWQNGQVLGCRDFVDQDTFVLGHHNHGMNVLSIMAANLGGMMVGTAPKASYWLLRSEDTDSEYRVEEDNWIAAAEFADSIGADIITTSLGYNTFDDTCQNYTYEDLDGNTARITIGADIAASKGILVVASAGNDGSTSWHYINFPADGDSVMAVGAVSSDSAYASLSSTGPTSDGRIKPNVMAQGKSTYVAISDTGYYNGSGTSFAAPIISGLAACLWQAHPELTNIQLMEVIEESADQYFSPDSLKGYGLPDFYQAHLILRILKEQNIHNSDLAIVYPNPFTDRIEIDFYSVDSQEVKIELFDLMGRMIYSNEQPVFPGIRNQLDITGLSSVRQGVYVLRIRADEKAFKYKLIK